MAMAAKLDGKKHKVFCGMSDGELNEGQSWEAFMFAAKNKLDNLIVLEDRNYIQIDGNTEDIMPLDSLKNKMQAFNWRVIEINGHNMAQVVAALKEAKKTRRKPTMVICNVIPGAGVSFMEGKYEWHGKPPTKEQAADALEELK